MAIKHYVLLCIVLNSTFLLKSDALPTTQNLLHHLQKRSGFRLCGRMLVEALAAVCLSEYYTPVRKRNFPYGLDYDAYSKEILEPQTPLDFFSPNQPTRRGIVDECCMNSCNLQHLASYCNTKPFK